MLTAFLDFIDQRKVVRRVVFLAITGVSVYFPLWAMRFAETTQRPGGELALIYGAIWTPLTVLLGFVFHKYDASSPKT